MTESTLSGTHDGEFDGIPPTREAFEIGGMAKFVLEDGELEEENAYFDRYNLLSQIGLATE